MDVVVYILATIMYGAIFYAYCLGGWFMIAGDESFAMQWKHGGTDAKVLIVAYYVIMVALIVAFILGTGAYF